MKMIQFLAKMFGLDAGKKPEESTVKIEGDATQGAVPFGHHTAMRRELLIKQMGGISRLGPRPMKF